GADTVTIGGGTNLWMLTGANAGALNDFVAFTGIERLLGGTGDDAFRPNSGVTFAGSIDGGGGFNTVDYSAQLVAVTIDRRTTNLPGVTTYSGIGGVIGSPLSDTVRGPDAATTWTLTGPG